MVQGRVLWQKTKIENLIEKQRYLPWSAILGPKYRVLFFNVHYLEKKEHSITSEYIQNFTFFHDLLFSESVVGIQSNESNRVIYI